MGNPKTICRACSIWRNRIVQVASIDYETLDNLGEATSMAVYDASVSSVGLSGGNVQINAGSGLRAMTNNSIGNRGQVYQSTEFGVDPVSGNITGQLVTNVFYDGRLDAVETDAPGGLVTRGHL